MTEQTDCVKDALLQTMIAHFKYNHPSATESEIQAFFKLTTESKRSRLV